MENDEVLEESLLGKQLYKWRKEIDRLQDLVDCATGIQQAKPKQGMGEDGKDEMHDKEIHRCFEEFMRMPPRTPGSFERDGDGDYEMPGMQHFFMMFDYAYRKGMWSAVHYINDDMAEQIIAYEKEIVEWMNGTRALATTQPIPVEPKQDGLEDHRSDSVPGIRQCDEASASGSTNSTSRESLPNSCESGDPKQAQVGVDGGLLNSDVDRARQILSELCHGKHNWQMRVPVDPDDSDQVLSRCIRAAAKLEANQALLRVAKGALILAERILGDQNGSPKEYDEVREALKQIGEV